MDTELQCDFYFGDKVDSPIKLMDYTILSGYKKTLRNINIPKTGFTWQIGAWQLILSPYKHYIITGSPGSLSNWVLIILAIPLGKKVYAWTHGMKGNNTIMGKLIEKKFYHLCNKILLYGTYSKKIMLSEGFDKNKLIPIYNSLDYANQVEIRKKLFTNNVFKEHFKNDNPVLVYIGRVQKSKKIDLLFNSLKILAGQGHLFNLIIIGEEVDNSNVSNLITNSQLSKQVWHYGACYEEMEIANLFYNSDICISPGLIGLTAIHAMTYGVPVITSDQFNQHGPEFEAIIPGITGDFFRNDNTDDLAKNIIKWVTLVSNEKEQIRQNCYKVIETRYNPYYQVETLKKLIL